MDNQESLMREFQLKKCSYEEQQDSILSLRDRGFYELDEIAAKTIHYLKDYVPEQDFISQAIRELDKVKDEISELAHDSTKQLERQIDNLEDNYYRAVRTLDSQQHAEKVSDRKW